MFKIIFNHLSSQVINKPSIASKFNKWGLSKSDININRFETTLLHYKKELLSSKYNIKKNINYNNFFLTESLFYVLTLVLATLITLFFISTLVVLSKNYSFIESINYTFFYFITNTFIFSLVIVYVLAVFVYFLLLKNKQTLLKLFNLKG